MNSRKKTSRASTKQLNNAPLIYTLAQIKFGTIADLSSYIPKIQDRLRKLYPKYNERQENFITFTDDNSIQHSMSKSWEFISINSRTGIALRPDSFVLHTSEYENHESFFDKLRESLNLVNDVLEISYISRIGLRYVDLILPENREDLDRYITDELKGHTVFADEYEIEKFYSETLMKTKYGKQLVKFYINTDKSFFPKELGVPNIQAPEFTKEAKNKDVNGVLDFDHFSEEEHEFSVDTIIEKLDIMHECTSKAFKNVTTDYAKQLWA